MVRVDLDPVRGVAGAVREIAEGRTRGAADHQLIGWPKTSGSRGLRAGAIERRWGLTRFGVPLSRGR
jgi:bifunctional non-homologous end joining protein LigD